MARDTKHALLSPSKADRWFICPGSVALTYGLEDEPSEYADEGTAAHELAASCLLSKDQVDADSYLGIDIKVCNEDGTVRRTFTVDDDMAGYVQVYVDEIRRQAEGRELMVEERVDYSDYVGVPDQSGTSDAIVLDYDAEEIQVHDLKYGRGVKVTAEGNRQLLLYALGAYALADLMAEWKTVRVFVHQPRLDHLDEWTVTVEELIEFGLEAGRRAMKAMEPFGDSEAPMMSEDDLVSLGLLQADEKACRWCLAKPFCPELRETVQAEVFDDFDDLTVVDVDEIPMSRLPKPAVVDLVEVWLKAVRSRIQSEALAGHKVPGWKVVAGKKGARKWAADKVDEVLKKLRGMRFKKAEIYDEKLKSPTQIIDKLCKGNAKRQEVLSAFVEQAEGGMHVTSESDPRPAIDIDAPEDDFEDLT